MPRLAEVPRKDVTNPVIALMYDRKYGEGSDRRTTITGAPGNWESVYAAAPEVLEHIVRGFEVWRNPDRRLPPELREVALTRTGWAMSCQFIFSQHCKVFRAYGGTEEQVRQIRFWQVSDCFSDVERAVLAYTDCLCYDEGRVPDSIFETLRSHLPDEAVVELTHFVCMYVTNAVLTRAIRLEFDDRDDPIVEVPRPESVPADEVGAVARRSLVLPQRDA